MPTETHHPQGPDGPAGAAGQSVTRCLLVLSDALMMQDIAEGLAEVFPRIELLRAQSLDEAEVHLKTVASPSLAILEDRDAGPFPTPLATALAAVGAVIAVIGQAESTGLGSRFPALESPYGYSDLHDFLTRLRDLLGR